jgi:ribonuclease P protein component
MRQKLGFPRALRITKDNEFKRVISQGTKVRGEKLNLYMAQAQAKAFGVSISRKIKGSVIRNRLKRVFKECFRLNQKQFPDGKAYIVVVTRTFKKITTKIAEQILTDMILTKKDRIEDKNEKIDHKSDRKI